MLHDVNTIIIWHGYRKWKILSFTDAISDGKYFLLYVTCTVIMQCSTFTAYQSLDQIKHDILSNNAADEITLDDDYLPRSNDHQTYILTTFVLTTEPSLYKTTSTVVQNHCTHNSNLGEGTSSSEVKECRIDTGARSELYRSARAAAMIAPRTLRHSR